MTKNIKNDRAVKINPVDLLGRETVQVNLGVGSSYLHGKRVLVTGAGGSIGSELCHQVARFNPKTLILLDHNENSTYFVDIELRRKYHSHPPYIIPIIADIKDRMMMKKIFVEYKPEIIFHAAAHKHVPLMEINLIEAIKNNVFGSKIMMGLSDKYQCEQFVLISTDKAVNPISIMGYSKRIAELMMQTFKGSKTKFMAVRFGNVLESEGSVTQLFQRQIADGGPVTITHPEIARYFMTIEEAVMLIIQSASLGNGGEIFILDMGQPIKIINLARALISLSRSPVDIKIEYIGLRHGEKMHEELTSSSEKLKGTEHKQIFVATPNIIDIEVFIRQINHLETLLNKGCNEGILEELKKLCL